MTFSLPCLRLRKFGVMPARNGRFPTTETPKSPTTETPKALEPIGTDFSAAVMVIIHARVKTNFL